MGLASLALGPVTTAMTVAEEFLAGSRPLSHRTQESNIPFGHLPSLRSGWVHNAISTAKVVASVRFGGPNQLPLISNCWTVIAYRFLQEQASEIAENKDRKSDIGQISSRRRQPEAP